MMKKIRSSMVVAMTLVSFSALQGCYRISVENNGLKVPVRMNASKGTHGGHITATRWNHFFLFGLVPTSRPNIKEMLEPKVPEGGEIANLSVRTEMSFVNGLVCALVGIIYCPFQTTIEGDVVQSARSVSE